MTTTSTSPHKAFLRHDRTLGVAAMEARGFYYPVDLAIRGDGRLFGLSRSHEGDTRGVRVCVLDLDSEFYGVFGSAGDGDGQFIWATAIALDRDENVYVSDEYTQRITIFDSEGKFLDKWGVPGSGPGQLDGPCGLAFDDEDDLYVSDHRNNRIQKFAKDGRFLSSFGSEGSGDGQFNLPWGLTVAPTGDIYVADWRNDRVQKFSPDGSFMRTYGESGRGDGQFHRPSGVAVDADGRIYVADWGNERVQVIDSEGDFVMSLRGEATVSKWAQEFLSANVDEANARARSNLEPETGIPRDDPHEESSHVEKLFWGPVSVKVDAQGRLYVVDRNRHRIQVFRRG